MVRSMTGYGRGEAKGSSMTVTVEMKSVNHRFFECTVKCPRQFAFLEDKLKGYLQSRISRGKIDVFVTYDATGSSDTLEINEEFATECINNLKLFAKKNKIKNDISVSNLLKIDGVMSVTHKKLDEKEAEALGIEAAALACDAFINAREAEGARLKEDIISKVNNLLGYVQQVESLSPDTVREYRERLEQKMRELLDSANIDEQRLLTETAVFADKVAVDEETVRLRTHVSHLIDLLEEGGVIGKKLDFIVQEMNREANTTGSKCQNAEITKIVVDMKSEIEKIREQIQNIE